MKTRSTETVIDIYPSVAKIELYMSLLESILGLVLAETMFSQYSHEHVISDKSVLTKFHMQMLNGCQCNVIESTHIQLT